MKSKFKYVVVLAVLGAVAGAIPGWAQTAIVSGKVTDNDQPQAGVQLVYKSVSTGRIVKLKTDKKGEFYAIGVPVDVYNVTVLDASGKTVYTHDKLTVGQSGDDNVNVLTIDITKGATAKTPGGAAVGTAMAGRTQQFAGDAGTAGTSGKSGTTTEGGKVSKEEMERYKVEKAKVENINALITQYKTALDAKDWQGTIAPLQGMVAADPNRWEYFQALGNSQVNVGDYDGALQSFDKGIQLAQGYVSGTLQRDSKNPNTEPAKAKLGLGQMLAGEGNAYIKLKKNDQAIEAYSKAAELDPNPGTAYFNICATQYNSGNTEGALAACDKAIAADPNKADAYFIKGSLLIASSSLEKDGKVKPAPGTAEALKKYLELAPDGQHATDVKQMLEYIGSTVETTYKNPTKKK